MANKTFVPNPYDVLEISPDTPTTEIPKAFAMAMKRRNYLLDAIALGSQVSDESKRTYYS